MNKTHRRKEKEKGLKRTTNGKLYFLVIRIFKQLKLKLCDICDPTIGLQPLDPLIEEVKSLARKHFVKIKYSCYDSLFGLLVNAILIFVSYN